MDLSRKLALIDQQIVEANAGAPASFDDWRNKTEVIVRSVFGEDTPIHRKFSSIRYSPAFWTEQTDFLPYQRSGVLEAISVLHSAKLELEILAETAPQRPIPEAPPGAAPNRVFIIHGQNDARKYELEAFLQKLVASSPIILHQEPNGGRVLMEKLEDSAGSAGYAIALLTGDDVGRPKALGPDEDQPRPRQNVVFELGFFFGLIGRKRVAVLFEEGVERPSDISGLVYIALDATGGWKSKLASEIAHSGIEVDWNAVVHA